MISVLVRTALAAVLVSISASPSMSRPCGLTRIRRTFGPLPTGQPWDKSVSWALGRWRSVQGVATHFLVWRREYTNRERRIPRIVLPAPAGGDDANRKPAESERVPVPARRRCGFLFFCPPGRQPGFWHHVVDLESPSVLKRQWPLRFAIAPGPWALSRGGLGEFS
jgi:hypothetical protein